jgi:hypothetical protein
MAIFTHTTHNPITSNLCIADPLLKAAPLERRE